MNRPSAAKGFGGSARPGKSVPAGVSAREHADRASAFRSHQALYQQHVLPCRLRGDLSQAEPVLKLLAQSKTELAEVYRDLADLSESRQTQQSPALRCCPMRPPASSAHATSFSRTPSRAAWSTTCAASRAATPSAWNSRMTMRSKPSRLHTRTRRRREWTWMMSAAIPNR